MNQKRNVHFLSYGIFGLVALLFIPFWKPLIISGIFALALYPYLLKHYPTGVVPKKIAITCVTIVSCLIIVPVLMGSYSLSSKIIAFSQGTDPMLKTNNLSKAFSTKLTALTETLGLPPKLVSTQSTQKISEYVGETLVTYSTAIVAALPEMIISLFMFALILYLFLIYPLELKKKFENWKILSKSDLQELINVLQTSCSQCLASLVIVGLVQSSVVVVGALIAGFSQSAVLIFLITFICSFIPVIGASPIACVLALWLLANGEAGWGIFMGFVALIAGTIDNVLKPLLVKRGVEMDAIITLISIIGALIIFGLPGLFIGPVVASTAGYYFYKEFESE